MPLKLFTPLAMTTKLMLLILLMGSIRNISLVVIGPLHLGLELVYSQNNNYWDLCKSTNGIGEKENCLKNESESTRSKV
jgi:hypothetical protein